MVVLCENFLNVFFRRKTPPENEVIVKLLNFFLIVPVLAVICVLIRHHKSPKEPQSRRSPHAPRTFSLTVE